MSPRRRRCPRGARTAGRRHGEEDKRRGLTTEAIKEARRRRSRRAGRSARTPNERTPRVLAPRARGAAPETDRPRLLPPATCSPTSSALSVLLVIRRWGSRSRFISRRLAPGGGYLASAQVPMQTERPLSCMVVPPPPRRNQMHKRPGHSSAIEASALPGFLATTFSTCLARDHAGLVRGGRSSPARRRAGADPRSCPTPGRCPP